MDIGVKEIGSSGIVAIENQKISGSSAVAHVKVMLLLLRPLVVLLTLKCMHCGCDDDAPPTHSPHIFLNLKWKGRNVNPFRFSLVSLLSIEFFEGILSG